MDGSASSVSVNAITPLARLRYLLLAASRKIESYLPVSEQTRRDLRSSRFICKLLTCLFLTIFCCSIVFGVRAISKSPAPIRHNNAAASAEHLAAEVQALSDKVHLAGANLRNAANKNSALHGNLTDMIPANFGFENYDAEFKFPLDRPPLDFRDSACKNRGYGSKLPKASVVIIFCNEPFETLMRSVHSVLNTSPPELLKEIILVDDGSDAAHIVKGDGHGLLESYISNLPSKVRLIRTGGRTGIVQARLTGIRAAKGEAFVILDSHIECQPGWLEPLLFPIGQDKSHVTMPHIDGIDRHTFELLHGGVGCTLGLIWKVMEHAFHATEDSPSNRRKAKTTDYVHSPAMAGGLFAAHRDFFLEIGGYDEEMAGWGAENVEFSLRLWQCGGKLLCTPCSRVNHMFGGGKFYQLKSGSTTMNRMRTMAAWMDEYADVAWHVLGKPDVSEIGDMRRMNKLRKDLQCRDFQWFLDTVWPESELRSLPQDLPYMGPVYSIAKNQCWRRSAGNGNNRLEDCGNNPGVYSYWRKLGRISPERNDEFCVEESGLVDWCRDRFFGYQVEELDDPHLRNQLNFIYGAAEPIVMALKNKKGECLTATDISDSPVFEACIGSLSQKWGWARYHVDAFWKANADRLSNLTMNK